MKHALCIVFTSLAFYLSAQQDSLPKFRLSAITAEVQLVMRGEHANTATAADFQKHIPNDYLLNRIAMQANTPGYGISAYDFFPGVASVKAFFDLRPVKGHRRQAFIGLSYSRVQHLSLSYLNMVYDTTSTIMGTNNYTVNVDAYQSAYSFDISGIKLQVPVGINFITNNNRRFWFSAGAELCPGLSLANVYRAAYEKSRSQYVLDAYSSYNKVSSYKRSGNREVLDQASVKNRRAAPALQAI